VHFHVALTREHLSTNIANDAGVARMGTQVNLQNLLVRIKLVTDPTLVLLGRLRVSWHMRGRVP
jgi:hypothetical protein